MPTRITTLVNDVAAPGGLAVEHGLALWVEHEGHPVLFDTGASGRVLVGNASRLGVRLDEAEAACLSHGHYDHTGGLAGVLGALRGRTLHAHPAVFTPKYAKRPEGWQPIGMRLSREAIEAAGVRVSVSDAPQQVAPGATLLGAAERDSRFVPSTPHLFADDGTGRTIDPFHDDQSLVLASAGGLIVVSGCAHAGIINHCRAAQRLHPGTSIRAVVGGFHLVGASRGLIERTIQALRELGVKAVHPCHCTGDAATRALAQAFPERCQPAACGVTIEFG